MEDAHTDTFASVLYQQRKDSEAVEREQIVVEEKEPRVSGPKDGESLFLPTGKKLTVFVFYLFVCFLKFICSQRQGGGGRDRDEQKLWSTFVNVGRIRPFQPNV